MLAVVALLALSAPLAGAADSLKLTGSLAGFVRDGTGIPQMGATVLLLNRYERVIQRALTNDRGAFGFEFLTPETYSIHVSLSSFVPAMKQKIAVQPGMQSLLYINMASLLSSVELVYASPGQGALMSDDWKWSLKTSTSTRPVLCIAPEISISDPSQPVRTVGAIFSDTRGLLRVSAGDAGSLADLTTQSDLGTGFAVATSILGKSQLQVSGNVGHTARIGLPAASLRTSYSYEGVGPEIEVTVRQIYLPSRVGSALAAGSADGLPPLRTMSVAFLDRVDLTDGLRLEYGMSLDSVAFVDHMNYFSPFARLSENFGSLGTVRAAYSSGAPPSELFSHTGEAEASLNQDLIALALMPHVSLRGGRARVERTQSFELGWEKKLGSRTLNLTGYKESVSNATLTMAAPEDLLPGGDILSSVSGRSATFDIGSYQRFGYAACFTQTLGEKLEVSTSTGHGGELAADALPLASSSGEDIRSKIHTSQRYWAAVRATGTIPVTGTQVSTSYQWMDYNTIAPSHLYLTQKSYPEVGWNIHIRQPIPSFPGMLGRLEATADLRNMLAQGYLALPSGDSRRVLLMQSPRAVRGGLSFIF